MSLKHLTSGSTFPPLPEDKERFRVYSNAFCPYAQRTRLVLEHKKIPYEVVNIHLKNKPEWFTEKTPLGLVPVIEKGDQIVLESTATCDYLDDCFPTNRLQPNDPYRRAWDRILLEYFGRVTSAYTSIYRSLPDYEAAIPKILSYMKFYEDILVKRGGPFFGGNSAAMIDLFMWPHMERLAMLGTKKEPRIALEKSDFPKLLTWYDKMYDLEAVKATRHDNDTYYKYMETIFDASPKYDMGIKE